MSSTNLSKRKLELLYKNSTLQKKMLDLLEEHQLEIKTTTIDVAYIDGEAPMVKLSVDLAYAYYTLSENESTWKLLSNLLKSYHIEVKKK